MVAMEGVAQAAGVVLAVLDEIERATGSNEMPTQHIRILCALAARGEIPMADLEQVTGTTQAAISRACAKLGSGQSPREPGFGLLEAFEDPWYRKRKLVKLTPRGHAMMRDIAKAVIH